MSAKLTTAALTTLALASFMTLFVPIPARADEPRQGTVTYVTAKTIYVDLGKSDGLFEGAELSVHRDGLRIATLTVTSLASYTAACAFEADSVTMRAGDPVTILRGQSFPTQSAPEPVTELVPEPTPLPTTERRSFQAAFLKQYGISGRLAFRFTGSDDLSGNGEDYSQPALDLRLRGEQIAGTEWGAEIDLRMRTTYRTLPDGDSPRSSRSRVYRMSASREWQGHASRITLGRQVSSSLAAVSVFDGILGEKRGTKWKLGAFAGMQPDARDYGLSREIREFGGFVEFGRRPTRTRSLTITAGAIGSYGESDINREYLFLQNRIRRGRVSANLSHQIDINREWRYEAEGNRLSLTNTYASLRYDLTESLALESGFDNRRAVRLYRHMITPETDFDDSYRQGAWGGATQRFGTRFRTSLRHRVRSGGSVNAARSTDWTANLNLRELSGLNLRARTTIYDNGRGNGRLLSGTLGLRIGSRTTLSGTQGERVEDPTDTNPAKRRLTWTTAELDMNLPAHCYLTLSVDWNQGNDDEYRVIHGSTSYRF